MIEIPEVDDDCRSGLDQLKGLLSHVDPQMTLGELLGRVVREAVERHDPSRPPRRRRSSRQTADVADETSAPKDTPGPAAAEEPLTAKPAGITTSAPKAECAPQCQDETSAPKSAGPEVAAAPRLAAGAGGGVAARPRPRGRGRGIPAAVRRQVWERDRGCCSYVDRGSGRRCGSRHLLEIDHVFPFALGGGAEPENLRLLCAAHHRYRHARRAAARGSSKAAPPRATALRSRKNSEAEVDA